MKNKHIGSSWDEFEKTHFTAEEIAESDLRVAVIGEIIKARKEKGLNQTELGELVGVPQSNIARLESGKLSPQLNTLIKILHKLGKKLVVAEA